jgi:ferrous iron transport protein B
MATRVIDNKRDRLTTILVAPLMTCSARIPVYTLIIAAFIPHGTVWGFLNLQGLVMFGLYASRHRQRAGRVLRDAPGVLARTIVEPFMLELPTTSCPTPRTSPSASTSARRSS